MKRRKHFKKWGSRLLKTTIVLFLALCIVECVYRYQWVDFYKKEWRFQNKQLQPDQHKKRVLVFGDSFSADTSCWVWKWTNSNTTQVFNAAIPGTGPEVFRLIAANRISATHPDLIVVQLYEGNDLYDLRKPVNWRQFSFWRNLYWSSGNVFRSLGFINYRLGQTNADVRTGFNSKKQQTFHRNRYDARTKLYISGDATYPSGMVLLKGAYADDMRTLIGMLKEIQKEAGKKTRFYVLTIPSCVQVHKRYWRQYKRLGATNDPKVLTTHPWATELKKAGFTVIDPINEFRLAEKQGVQLYFANDPHLNAAGQELLATCVRKSVEL